VIDVVITFFHGFLEILEDSWELRQVISSFRFFRDAFVCVCMLLWDAVEFEGCLVSPIGWQGRFFWEMVADALRLHPNKRVRFFGES